MKNLVCLLLTLLPLVTLAQGNGGISNENVSTKIEWIGLSPGGDYVVQVTNKQSCAVDMHVQFGGASQFRTKNIAGGASDTFWISAPPSNRCFLGARPETLCGGTGDRGTVELNTCSILPIKFSSITAQRIGSRSVRLTFVSEEDLSIEKYNVMFSLDGRTFQTATVLFPNGVEGKKTYTTIVNY